MIAWGLNDCQVSRLTGINRVTIREWRTGKVRAGNDRAGAYSRRNHCPRCGPGRLNTQSYAYLLGLYLGDGCIAACPRGVFRLRISLDNRYPGIIASCRSSIEELLLDKKMSSGKVTCLGCTEVYSYWKHWPCVFPQHGRGPKHLRPIKLRDWQQEIVDGYPHLLLRGLIHSDGYRGLNKVNRRWGTGCGSYAYPSLSVQQQFRRHSTSLLRCVRGLRRFMATDELEDHRRKQARRRCEA
jgi:hypothetical protein